MAETGIKYDCDLVVIGGSAGAFDVILQALGKLQEGLRFPIIIVLHRKSSFDSMLSDLFSVKTRIPVKEAEDKDLLEPGHIYLAPPDYHMLIESDHTVGLDASEKVQYSRPSIDVTFQSAADVFGAKLVCILLSGANADGVDGLLATKNAGGLVVVQDPNNAGVSYMPAQAMQSMEVDHVIKGEEIAEFINAL
ncbi:MAG: chemotaxis protein CheB [Sphingobacteriales bacterium]|nr:MAG: chemotaxis protein CheB [Sphingobacteriales bacterium]